MINLQKIFTFYLNTKPTPLKIKNATNLLIHACQALNVDSPEDIDENLLVKLPTALDEYFSTTPQKAVLDKGTLAEMLGRVGPTKELEEVFNQLFNESDSNLKQFTLQSLEYYGQNHLQEVLPVIDHFRTYQDPLMKEVSAILLARLSSYCDNDKIIKAHILNLANEDCQDYLKIFFNEIKKQAENSVDIPERKAKYIQMRSWLTSHFEYLR